MINETNLNDRYWNGMRPDMTTAPGNRSMQRAQMPGMQRAQMPGMQRAQMPGMQQPPMPGMQQAPTPGMQRAQMPGMQQAPMPGMRQVPMPGMPQAPIPGMPQAPMPGMQQAPIPGMPQAQMPGMRQAPMPGMQQAPMPGAQPVPAPGLPQDVLQDMEPTLTMALSAILEALRSETADRLFYNFMITLAPDAVDLQLISSARDDEIRHFDMFRQLYTELTGTSPPQIPQRPFEEPASYCDGLKRGVLSEQHEVEVYRVILFAMQQRPHINLMTEIITDELRHMGLFNYMYAKNQCRV
jgi:rubrerythrin